MLRFLIVWALLASSAAYAADVDEAGGLETSMHKSPHTEESAFLLGLKGIQLSEFPPEGESLFGGGVGVFAETTLVPGWLEVELSTSLVRVSGGDEQVWVVPIDLILKKPFHFGSLCPYFGVGPTVSIGLIDDHDGAEVGAGAAAVVGFYYWFSDIVGLDVEVDYAVIGNDGVQHELTFAAGPTLRL